MTKQTDRAEAVLRLKVSGPGVGNGRISIPDLVKICQDVQAAVTRQAEAMEGQPSLRPGRYTAKAKIECTLDLIGVRKGSTVLPFAMAKRQESLDFPNATTLGRNAITEVAEIIHSLGNGGKRQVDPGVLDSLNNLATVFDRHTVSKIDFFVPKRIAKKREIRASFTPAIRDRITARIKTPSTAPRFIDGTLEMADFKPGDHRCRITPALGQSIICSFSDDKEQTIQDFLRKTVRVTGEATIDPNTRRIELRTEKIEPIPSFAVGAHDFYLAKSFQELAESQGVAPLSDPNMLRGVFSPSDNLDEMLEEIYLERS